MNWHKLSRGPYCGKTLLEVIVQDLDYVLDGLDGGEFTGSLLAEAAELCRRASRIRVPCDRGEQRETVVFYNLLPDGSYGGLAVVPMSDPKLSEYARLSAARTEGCFDLTILRRIAPADREGRLRLIQAVEYVCLGERLTWGQFFDDPKNFLDHEEQTAASESRASRGAAGDHSAPEHTPMTSDRLQAIRRRALRAGGAPSPTGEQHLAIRRIRAGKRAVLELYATTDGHLVATLPMTTPKARAESLADLFVHAKADVLALTEEIERLRDALALYGKHAPECASGLAAGDSQFLRPCICGFAELLHSQVPQAPAHLDAEGECSQAAGRGGEQAEPASPRARLPARARVPAGASRSSRVVSPPAA